MRSNYKFAEGVVPSQQLGQCGMKISTSRRKVEPVDAVKGAVARTYLYMDKAYTQYRTGQK